MAINVGDALVKLGLDKKDFDRDMKGLRGAIQKHRKAIGVAMAGMAVAAIGGAVASIKAFADMGDEVQKMALRTGFSTEALSELRHAAEISGASLSTLEKGVKRMSGTILDAQDGMETYIRAFEHLGIQVQELDELNPEEQFLRIAEAIAEVEDPTKRAALAQDIFGRAGTELLPLFAAGKEGLKDLRQEAHKLGIVFDKEAAESAADFKDSLTELDGAMNGLKFTLAKELMPAIDEAIPLMTELAVSMGPVIANILNWHRAEDKLRALRLQHIRIRTQTKRAVEGWNNTLEEEIDILEKLYIRTGLMNDEIKVYIAQIREVAAARNIHIKAIEDETEATEELTEAQQEQLDLYESTLEMIEDAIKALEYEESAAGELRIEIDDVIKALHKMGLSNEEITETLLSLGDEQDNVLRVLEAFGLTALDVATALGIEIKAVEALEEAYQDLGGTARNTAADMKRVLEEMIAMGEKPSESQVLAMHRQRIVEAKEKGISVREVAGQIPFQHGGLITQPTLLTRVGSSIPYGIMAEKRPEYITPMGAGQMMTVIFEVDGRQMARTVMPYAVGEIRLKTGAKI